MVGSGVGQAEGVTNVQVGFQLVLQQLAIAVAAEKYLEDIVALLVLKTERMAVTATVLAALQIDMVRPPGEYGQEAGNRAIQIEYPSLPCRRGRGAEFEHTAAVQHDGGGVVPGGEQLHQGFGVTAGSSCGWVMAMPGAIRIDSAVRK